MKSILPSLSRAFFGLTILTGFFLCRDGYAQKATPTDLAKPLPGATIIIFDASGSMRGRIKGETKMEIARRVMRDLVTALPAGTKLGLVAYGHRRASDCADIELLIKPGALDKDAFIKAVGTLEPRGMTPISAAVEFAANALGYKENAATIVLVSDGLETCGKDPCATVRALKKTSPALTVHTVAFDLSAKEAKAIECVAAETGGRFLQANDAASLKDALEMVVIEATTAAAPPPAEVLSPAVVTAPAEVTAGSVFNASWSGPDNPGDYVTIVAKGAADGTYENYSYTRQGSPLSLTALVEPGEAEVRYVAARSRTVLARAAIKVTSATVTLAAAETAVGGAVVDITWTGPNNKGDYITIVPRRLPDGRYENYLDTSRGSPLTVAAPMEPGEAEIRYMSGQGAKVLARRPLRVTAAKITLDAQAQAPAASIVSVVWTGPNNAGDFITIVPKATPDTTSMRYISTRSGSPAKVTAPPSAGPAEIRYVSGQGNKVLARRDIQLGAPAK